MGVSRGMHGSIKPVRMGRGSLGRYLAECSAVFGEYLEGHGSTVLFSRMSGGSEDEGRLIDAAGLDAMLRGEDPFSGEKLRDVKDGQIGCYDIPLNDCKGLEVLGVRYEDVRDAHREAQRRGMEAVKSYLSTHLLARRQDHGVTRFMKAEQLLFASAEHWTSRDGDPHMHTHLELMNMCLADGKWVAVDSRQLYHMYENIRSIYETTIYGDPRLRAALASHGASISLRGGIPQLADGAEDVFSKRRDEIERRLAELVDQWRENHAGGMAEVRDPEGHVVGHTGYRDTTEPDRLTMVKLRQQAWADTRKAKGESNTRVDWDTWCAELKGAGYDPDRLLDGRPVKPAPLARDVDAMDADLCALNAVNALGEMHSAWSRNDLEVAVYDQIRELDVTGTRAEIEELAGRIGRRALELCTSLDDDPRAALPFMKSLTSAAVVECEDDLKGRLAARGAEHTANPDLGRLAAEYTLDPGQRDAVETICKGDPLAVVEGAAGAGKTHMLKAVKAHCDATGRRLMLVTPYRKAAETAHDEVGADTCTVMKLLEAYGYRHDERTGVWSRVRIGETDFRGNTYRGVRPAFHMDEGTRLVVDEAGMLDQEQGRRLLAIADETGASVTLVGDTAQKGAVGRGGVLALAKRYTANAVDMTDVHRFEDPDYAEFSLRLRDHCGATAPALARELLDRGLVATEESDERTVEAIAGEWMRVPGTTVSTATNRQANAVNMAVQARRLAAGQLGGRAVPDMIAGESIREGDTVMCRANDEAAHVFNREVYTVTAVRGDGGLRLRARDGGRRTVSADYARDHMQLGYAATTYGVQGITCDHAVYWAAPGGDGGDMYVALTRGRLSNRVFMTATDRDEALETLEGVIGRGRGDTGLDAARSELREQVRETDPRTGTTEADRGRLARLERSLRGALDAAGHAGELWEKYRHAAGREEALAGRLADARRDEDGIGRELAAARASRQDRPNMEAEYIAVLRNDPVYRTALREITADADRLADAEADERELRDRMRRLDSRPVILRPLDAGRREDTASRLDRARRRADALRRSWIERWDEAPRTAGDRRSLERIALDKAGVNPDPAGEAARLKAMIDGADGRVAELEARADAAAQATAGLADRHAQAKEAAARALAAVPAWYRTDDMRATRAADCEAIRSALAAGPDTERLKLMESTYRRLTGREFEPGPKPAGTARPSAAAARRSRPRTTPDPYAQQAAPLPMPSPAGMAMPPTGPAVGPDFGI